MDRYAVMGNPIEHSKSPRIHGLFAEQTHQAMTYDKQLVPEDGFPEAVSAFQQNGGSGLNITVPFKEQAWGLAERRSARAERAGAVNTLSFSGGECYGDNTDGAGLVRDITVNHATPLAGQQVLVVGAGGAVRGVLPAILATAPQAVRIANRTADKASALAEEMADLGPIQGGGFDTAAGQRFNVVVNATSAGLSDELPELPEGILAPGALAYDMVYADEPTAFVRWARQQGAAMAVDGLGMLVEQAAESFLLWRGVRPETTAVIEALRPRQ
jgi:shikimate dehydrogenase